MNDHDGLKEIRRINDDSVVVFGTALHAVKCLYYLRNKSVQIKYFLDNYRDEETFYGYSVYKPIKERVIGNFILGTTTLEVKNHINLFTKKLKNLSGFRNIL